VLLWSGAFLRGDGREGRPALLYLTTTAVRAGGFFGIVLCDVQFFRECFLAGVAEELVVGHTDLPESLTDSIWILDPRLEQVQHFNVPSEKQIQRTLLAYGADN
jgi:hypothetical protein